MGMAVDGRATHGQSLRQTLGNRLTNYWVAVFQIYLAMLCTLLMWDTLPGFEMRWGIHGIIAMLAFDIWLTAS